MAKRFNPNYEYSRSIMEGYEAFYEGQSREDCPFPESEEYLRWSWLEGWDLARNEHMESPDDR